jgi:hypothetical protein
MANREPPEFEDTVGLFATTVLLRIPLRPADTLRELTGRARDATLRARSHQWLPLEVVLDGLPDLGLPFAELVPVALAFEAPHARPPGEGAAFQVVIPDPEDLPLGLAASAYPLSLTASPVGDGVRLLAEYHASLGGDLVDRMLGDLAAVLRTLVTRPDLRLGELEAAGDR